LRNNSCSGEREPLLLDLVLCELGKVDRRKKSRANREQLRCCNWIRLPIGPYPETFRGGRREEGDSDRDRNIRQEPEYLSGPPHSCCSRPAVSGRSHTAQQRRGEHAKKLL